MISNKFKPTLPMEAFMSDFLQKKNRKNEAQRFYQRIPADNIQMSDIEKMMWDIAFYSFRISKGDEIMIDWLRFLDGWVSCV